MSGGAKSIVGKTFADGVVTPLEIERMGEAVLPKGEKPNERIAAQILHKLSVNDVAFISKDDRDRLKAIAHAGLRQASRWYSARTNISSTRSTLLPQSLSTQRSTLSVSFFFRDDLLFIPVLGQRLSESYAVGYDLFTDDHFLVPFNIGRAVHLHKLFSDKVRGFFSTPMKLVVLQRWVPILDRLEKLYYVGTKSSVMEAEDKIVGSGIRSKRARRYLKGLLRKRAASTIRVKGVRVRIRGARMAGIEKAVKRALEGYHSRELEIIRRFDVNIFDLRYKTSDGFMYDSKPRQIFLNNRLRDTVSTLRHELGHLIAGVYGGSGTKIDVNGLWGIAHHHRTYLQPCLNKACFLDRTPNIYAGDSSQPSADWFAEVRRLVMNPRGYVDPQGIEFGFSTIDELERKDPVGYLVFHRYRQFLDQRHRHPELAFSMTSFHQARALVAKTRGIRSSGNEITDVLLDKWERMPLDLRAERLVRKAAKLAKRWSRLEVAIAKLKEACLLIPEYTHARFKLAMLLLEAGMEREAILQVGEMIKYDPYSLVHHARPIISVYLFKRLFKPLCNIFYKLIELEPNETKHLRMFAKIMKRNPLIGVRAAEIFKGVVAGIEKEGIVEQSKIYVKLIRQLIKHGRYKIAADVYYALRNTEIRRDLLPKDAGACVAIALELARVKAVDRRELASDLLVQWQNRYGLDVRILAKLDIFYDQIVDEFVKIGPDPGKKLNAFQYAIIGDYYRTKGDIINGASWYMWGIRSHPNNFYLRVRELDSAIFFRDKTRLSRGVQFFIELNDKVLHDKVGSIHFMADNLIKHGYYEEAILLRERSLRLN